MATKASAALIEPNSAPTIAGDVQPGDDASTSAETPRPSAAIPAICAPRSNPRFGTVGAGATWRSVSATASTPTGRLIKNTPRHDHAATIAPPTTGPLAAATPATPPQMPIARARSAGAANP